MNRTTAILATIAGVGAGGAVIYFSDRARGAAASARITVESRLRPSDSKLAERVRSRIENAVSHPGAIDVSAHEGVVILSGSVLADEMSDLTREASNVRGVRHLENRLRVHRSAEGAPELKGEAKRPEWPRALRTIVGMTGGALTMYGMRRRHDALGRVASIVGTGLLAQRIANEKLRKIIRMAA